ncbi:ferrous iron transport protein B [candidate division WOR-3 bacterium]|uniref:Ferrous iron transport protein B n=1 Tax=candidate division WOR-3 bacterium TaxID=2052148 RepID=A0A660SJ37_UNCW3|nr:MAG: ferrous iron transport protein B [candidate division WOR-3 bacterium]
MKRIKIALAGNPNSGKTTVFNSLTGSRQHVGNWPGVTVERKEGKFSYGGCEVDVVDLPGIYGLTAYSLDERIARDFLIKETPDVVVAVIDASNLERNLYLVAQLLELRVNVILDLNMMDLVEAKGISIDTEKLSRVLGIPVVKTVANKGDGIEDLKKAIVAPPKRPGPFQIDYDPDIEAAIERLSDTLKNKGLPKEYPLRWLIVKLLEGDAEILEKVKKLPEGSGIEEAVLKTTASLERNLGYDLETAMVERRYGFLKGLVRECSEKRLGIEERLELSDRIDSVVTNKFLGIPIFLALMWLTFQFVFALGTPLADLIDSFFGWLGTAAASGLTVLNAPGWLSSLISDGIIAGVGSVLVFLPNIMLLFLAIAILEDSGYMARAAFVMDRFMHALGLHGKSFIPLILGFGCNIPGIMATRTLESRKDRILTILVNPLMSCSARLPIYTLFAGAFFSKNQGSIIFSLYLLGIILAVVVARIFKTIFFRHEVAPLIMELPPYRLPMVKGVIIHMWERGSLFLKKAGTIIFAGVILIWLLASLPVGVEYASEESLIGRLGSALAPVLSPAGFGFWQAGVALFFGVVAKEVVVGTLGTLYGVEEAGLRSALLQYFTPLSAYAFMVMSLIYIPCIAAIATIKRETNWKWTGLAVGYSLILGWIVAVLIYQIGGLF